MRALVLWASPHHPNLGVAALAEGSAALLRRAFGDDVDVRFHATGGADLPGNDGPVNIWHIGPLLKGRVRDPGPLRDWVRSFDLILDTRAGDGFADIYSVKNVAKMTPFGLLARQWGVPVAMGPQTIGPFDTARGRALARLSLHTAKSVMARDAASAEQARKLGRPVDLVATDVAFAIPPSPRLGDHDVLLNPSGLLWSTNTHVDAGRYRGLMHETIETLEGSGRTVSLLAHVAADRSRVADNDVTAVDALEDRVSGGVVIPSSLEDVRSAVASSRLVIGARMHACLNALSSGTPAIALAYSRKFAPLLEQIGWTHTLDLRTGGVSAGQIAAVADQQESLDQQAESVRSRADEMIDNAAELLRRIP